MAAAGALSPLHASAQSSAPANAPDRAQGVQIVSVGDEPELRVAGLPLFVNAAQFDYFRIPSDLWIGSLTRYRELGINTIDLRIPWNWHEVSDGVYDFEGHTNPRRNLRGLLRQITQMGLKLIVNPGPSIGDNWRNGGYPQWLLGYSDYKMSAAQVQKGEVPEIASLVSEDSNHAARALLGNELHMSYSKRWLTAVGKELAPYSADASVSIPNHGAHDGEATTKQAPGPILFVQLEDTVISQSSDSPELAHYFAELRGALARGGLEAITVVNNPNAADRGATLWRNSAGAEGASRIAFAGRWFFQPSAPSGVVRSPSLIGIPAPSGPLLTTESGERLVFLARSLGTQDNFPPFLSQFGTTKFVPANDTHLAQPAPENTLLGPRLLLASGLRGMVYTPLQDTLTPAGWGIPTAGRYYRWDAALDLAGNRRPRASGVLRNGELISAWGAMLASSHVRADFAILDLRPFADSSNPSANARITREMQQLFRVSAMAGFTPELVDPASESVERLLRDKAIALPAAEAADGYLDIPVKVQDAVVDFIKRGGSLVYFSSGKPAPLVGRLMRPSQPNSAAGDKFTAWPLGEGRVVEAVSTFYSRVSLDADLGENRADPDSAGAIETLNALLEAAGVRRALQESIGGEPAPYSIASLIVPNASAAADRPQPCSEGQLCAASLVSVTNLSPDRPLDETLDIEDPRPVSGKSPTDKLSFGVTVPARDSLMLPVHAPLCSASAAGEACSDEVVVAGSELLGAEREGKTLELGFYAPARAIVRLRLESEPSKVELDEDIRLDADWKPETNEVEVRMPRGAAPDYRRVLRVHLRYTPHVTEKLDPEKTGPRNTEHQVLDGIRFPVADDVTIPTGPPLIATDLSSGGHVVIASVNRSDETRMADFVLDGAFHGTASARIFGDEELFTRLHFQPLRSQSPNDPPVPPRADGLLRGTLSIRTGHERGSSPVLYVAPDEGGYAHYQYDFDRDGSPEWALESSRLRLIVSPADSGRALALTDKSTNDDLIVLGGAAHDFIAASGLPPQDVWEVGDFAFNRAYRPEWIEGKPGASLRLTFQEHENSAAGIHVEKTLRLPEPETVEVAYRIFEVSPTSGDPGIIPAAPRNFISMMSIPLLVAEDKSSHVCWQPTESDAPGEKLASKPSAALHCEDIVPGGNPIPVPVGVTRMEIASPGSHTLTTEWHAGRVTVVPRMFSVEIDLAVPVPGSSQPPDEFTLRYTVGKSP